jgi:hypothetical protein
VVTLRGTRPAFFLKMTSNLTWSKKISAKTGIIVARLRLAAAPKRLNYHSNFFDFQES